MIRRYQWPLRVAKAIAWVGLILVAVVGYQAWRIWSFKWESGTSADAAIVLGAITRQGLPSPAFEQRILHGITLYRSHRVTKLIFTGGIAPGERVALAVAAKKYAVEHGVPESDILVEAHSRYTRENLLYAREIAEEQGLHSFLIVSDPLHLRRAMTMAADLGMTAWPSGTPTSAYNNRTDRLWFLRRETYS